MKQRPDWTTVEPSTELNQITMAIIGAAIEVHRNLGPGFLESIYEEALCVELRLRGIPFVRQRPVAVDYRGYSLGEAKLDLLVGDAVVVELKAAERFTPIHSAQVMSYLKATGCKLGLPINFNVPRLTDGVKRVVLSKHRRA